jgi:hypothetical protein
MGMKDKMMDFMMGKMSKEDKEEMMGKMMERFFAEFSPEEKQKMMEEMMPKMMEGVNMKEMMPKMMMSMMRGGEGECGPMEMMSQMKAGGREKEASMMPQMMMEMMPKCLEMMLPNVPAEKKIDFVLKMVTSLVEHGGAGMSENEKKDFISNVIAQVKA